MSCPAADPQYDIDRRVREIRQPFRVTLELTRKCRFRCVHCFLKAGTGGRELTTGEWCRLMEELAGLGTLMLTFTGGDLFLRDDLPALFREARRLRFVTRIFTNAEGVTPEIVEMLRETPPFSVDVSLYGVSRSSYQEVTGRGEIFPKVLRGIRLLRQAGFRTHIKFPVLRENAHDYFRIREYCRRHGHSLMSTTRITEQEDGGSEPCEHMIRGEEQRKFFEEFGSVVKGAVRVAREAVCYAGLSHFVVSPEGEVWPCENIRLSAGSAIRESAAQVWRNSPLLNELRRFRNRNHTRCFSCSRFSVCQPCPGLSYLVSGRWSGSYRTTCQDTELLEHLGKIEEVAHEYPGKGEEIL